MNAATISHINQHDMKKLGASASFRYAPHQNGMQIAIGIHGSYTKDNTGKHEIRFDKKTGEIRVTPTNFQTETGPHRGISFSRNANTEMTHLKLTPSRYGFPTIKNKKVSITLDVFKDGKDFVMFLPAHVFEVVPRTKAVTQDNTPTIEEAVGDRITRLVRELNQSVAGIGGEFKIKEDGKLSVELCKVFE